MIIFRRFLIRDEDKRGFMKRIILLMALALSLSGCATSTSQTHFVDAKGRDCLKTFKKVAPLGIAVGESVECAENTGSVASQITLQKTQNKYFFGLF